MIRRTSKELHRRGLPVDTVLIIGDYFVEATEMTTFQGLPLTTTWFLVNAQEIYCRAGTSVNNESFVCDECVDPYTSDEGNGVCSQCLADYFLASNGECKACPDHAECPDFTNTSTIDLDKGYWRASKASYKVLACRYAEFCVGGDRCLAGHEGTYCRLCRG